MKYITIDRSEDFESALSKLQMHIGNLSSYGAYDSIETLMGSAKILKLRRHLNIKDIEVKIDGPGFIIEKLYKYFAGDRETE